MMLDAGTPLLIRMWYAWQTARARARVQRQTCEKEGRARERGRRRSVRPRARALTVRVVTVVVEAVRAADEHSPVGGAHGRREQREHAERGAHDRLAEIGRTGHVLVFRICISTFHANILPF